MDAKGTPIPTDSKPEIPLAGSLLSHKSDSPRTNGTSLVGQTLSDKYLIEEELGRGGMCTVYKATHVFMGKSVAIKVLRPQLAEDSKIVERFEQEAQAASRILNPHAINVMDFGVTQHGSPFMVMDYIQGETLCDVLKKYGALTVTRAAGILQQVATALDAAHAQGVIHRDIKPENIILSEYDGRDWATVLDFGIAKLREDVNQKPNLTAENLIIGTPKYMSPEQAENKTVDFRTDIYSLGVVLYEMLPGEAPFGGDSSTRFLIKHICETPPYLREKRPDISPEVEVVVMRALLKDPEQRQQSALELSRDFATSAGVPETVNIDRGGAFTRITVDLPNGESEEETMIRPQFDSGPQTVLPLPGTPARGVIIEREYSPWPAVLIAVFAVAIIGMLGYIFIIRGWSQTLMGTDDINRAQRAVVDAKARLESLPSSNPLSSSLPQVEQWQSELTGFAAASQKTPDMVDRAHSIEQKANALSDQAKKAMIYTPNTGEKTATDRASTSAPPAADEDKDKKDATGNDTIKTLPTRSDTGDTTTKDADKDKPKTDTGETPKPKPATPPVIDPSKLPDTKTLPVPKKDKPPVKDN